MAKKTGFAEGALFLVLAILALLLATALWAAGVPSRQALAAGVVLLAMACWATDALPEVTAGLVFFALATLLRLSAPSVVFSGFASSAFWLVLGGMVVAQAMTRTGLGARIARAIAAPLSGSYPRLIAGTVLIAYALAFLMPSNIGRITLLMPIMLARSDRARRRGGKAQQDARARADRVRKDLRWRLNGGAAGLRGLLIRAAGPQSAWTSRCRWPVSPAR